MRHLGLVRALVAALACALLAACAAQADDAFPPVTADRLLHAANDDGWLMYRRTYDGQGHAPFDQITPENVGRLREVFTHRVALPEGFEAPPIVNGRTMIVTTPFDEVYALDAVTGEKKWEYDRPIPHRQLRTVCCDMVNRGVALWGTTAYLATLDDHVVALDARDGHVVWDQTIYPEPGAAYAMTLAPLALDGMIVVGVSGGEYGARGFVEALDAQTGAQRWRTYTIPAPDEPGGRTWPPGRYRHGGGTTWLTGAYDPELRTLYWGVGNPGPWLADERKGRNLYSDSLLALDPQTGRIRWYFQQTPNDSWDYDDTNTPVLADLTIGGRPRRVVMQAARNGWFYVVDRTNGDLISMTKTTVATTVTGYDRRRRIGIVDESKRPHVGKQIFTCPAFFGGTNWWPLSFDPATGYAFIPTMQTCMFLRGVKPEPFQAGATYVNEEFTVEHIPGDANWGRFQAIDVARGKRVWSLETKQPWNDGALSTASGLVFSGNPDRTFYAFDARTGKVLWSQRLASGIIGVPVSYRVDGKQYVAVQSGFGGVAPFYGGKAMTPGFKHIPLGGELYVFALPNGRSR